MDNLRSIGTGNSFYSDNMGSSSSSRSKESKATQSMDPNKDTDDESINDLHKEPKSKSKNEPKSDPKNDTKNNPKNKPKNEPKIESTKQTEKNSKNKSEIEPSVDELKVDNRKSYSQKESKYEQSMESLNDFEQVSEMELELDLQEEPKTNRGKEDKMEPKMKPKSEPEREPITESEKEPKMKSKSEPEKELKSKPEKKPSMKPKSEPEREPIKEPKSEQEKEPKMEPKSKPEKEPIKEPIKEPKSEPERKSITEPKSELERKPTIKSKSEPEKEPKSELQKEPIMKPKLPPEKKPVKEPKSKPVKEPITEPKIDYEDTDHLHLKTSRNVTSRSNQTDPEISIKIIESSSDAENDVSKEDSDLDSISEQEENKKDDFEESDVDEVEDDINNNDNLMDERDKDGKLNKTEREIDDKEVEAKTRALKRNLLENNIAEAQRSRNCQLLIKSLNDFRRQIRQNHDMNDSADRRDYNDNDEDDDDDDDDESIDWRMYFENDVRDDKTKRRIVSEYNEACRLLERVQAMLDELKNAKTIDKLQVWLKNISLSKNQLVREFLMVEEKEAKKLLKQMSISKRKMPVLSLNRKTIAEIYSYPNPKPIVHRVLQAALLLLGEPESKTQEWKKCQAVCKNQCQSGLISRFLKFDEKTVHPYLVARAENILETYEGEGKEIPLEYRDVKSASPGAATFYVWAKGIIAKYEDAYNNDEISFAVRRQFYKDGNFSEIRHTLRQDLARGLLHVLQKEEAILPENKGGVAGEGKGTVPSVASSSEKRNLREVSPARNPREISPARNPREVSPARKSMKPVYFESSYYDYIIS